MGDISGAELFTYPNRPSPQYLPMRSVQKM